MTEAEQSPVEQKRRARFVLRSMLYFWPMVDSADDVDRVTRFAYRVCIWALLLSAIPLAPELVSLNWIAWATLAVSAVLYFFGANAVRQGSTVAAATLCFMIATDIPYSYLFSHAFPWLSSFTLLAFLIVWRGIALAAKFQPSPLDPPPLEISDVLQVRFMPRIRVPFGRYMTDTLPSRIWPAYQAVFWIAVALLLADESFCVFAYIQMH